MKCPVCASVDLLMTDRQGVEIDYCPQCRGIWLDRGELDKLIERSAVPAPLQMANEPRRELYEHGEHKKHDHDDEHDEHHGNRRRKSWLGEIMDFG